MSGTSPNRSTVRLMKDSANEGCEAVRTSGLRRAGAAAIVLVAVPLLAACGDRSESEGGENSTSATSDCSEEVRFDGRTYVEAAFIPSAGTRLGDGELVACEDTGTEGEPAATTDLKLVELFSINGVDSKSAIARDISPDGFKVLVAAAMSANDRAALVQSLKREN